MTAPVGRNMAIVTRRVTINAAGVVAVNDAPAEAPFRVELVRPRSSAGSGSPRSRPAWTLRWRTGPFGPPEPVPAASSRLTLGLVAYELIETPRALMRGRSEVGQEVRAVPVTELYPFTGQLTEQSGVEVLAAIPFAMWSPSERRDSTGNYEDVSAESSVEFGSAIKRNRQIHVGGRIFRVLTAITELDVPRVVYGLRRAGG